MKLIYRAGCILLSLMLLSSCGSTADEQQIYQGISTKNRNTVKGTVISVIYPDSTRFKLSLRADEVNADSGSGIIAAEEDILTLVPFYSVREGEREINYSSDANKKMLGARDLKEGDEITAYITNGASENEWIMLSWEK